MRRLFYLLIIIGALILSACSLDVTKEEEGDDEDQEELQTTADLPEERKVREIELMVTTPDYDPVRYEFGLMIAAEWEKLGFDVEVSPTEWNRLSELGMQQKDFDAFTLSWGGRAERLDPDFFIHNTGHSSLGGFGGYNIPGYENDNFDALAEEQRRVSDPDERKALIREAEQQFLDDIPYAPIAHRDQIMPYNKTEFTNINYMVGEGLNSFWTFMEIEPTGDQKFVRWGYPSDINTLNPLNSTNNHDFQTTRLMYDRLVRISSSGEPQNWAAESIEDVHNDGTTYKVTLRDDLKFHDGEPVTAEDVKFSFELIKEVESPYFIGMVAPVDSIDIVDDLTVQFNLEDSFSPFIISTLSQIYIFPQHYWEPILEEKGAAGVLEHPNDDIIGSGPFKLDYWDREQEMKLVVNEDYFQRPKVDGILKIPYSSTDNMVAAVEQGQADIGGWWIEPIQAAKLEDNEDIGLTDVPDHGLYHLNYNMRRMPFDDLAVRQAFTYAIPKQKIIDEILEGYGVQAVGLIGSMNEFWHSSDLDGYDYDMDAARKVLEEAGYEWDEDGKIYYPEGKSDQDLDRGILREVGD